jgi:hypothetical protein
LSLADRPASFNNSVGQGRSAAAVVFLMQRFSGSLLLYSSSSKRMEWMEGTMQGPLRRLAARDGSRGAVSIAGEANRAKQAAAAAAAAERSENEDEDEEDEVAEKGEKLSRE